MSEVPPQLHAVGEPTRAGDARRPLRSSTARLRDWTWTRLAYHVVWQDRVIARVSGWALLDDNTPVHWSSVLKLYARSAGAPREIRAYRSALLTALPGHLRAPRLLGIDEATDGSFWLWLEDVTDVHEAPATGPVRPDGTSSGRLQRNLPGLAAAPGRVLVQSLAGAPSGRGERWRRFRIGFRRLGCTGAVADSGQPRNGVRSRIVQRTAQLRRDQAHFVGALERLPQTLCHHESSLANLFAVDRGDGLVETVAVDWEQIGPGPIGAEIATLVFGTLRRCEFDAEQALELDQVVFAGYVDGLREAGWTGPEEHVRLGFTGAVALRWSVLVSTLRLLVEGAQPVRTSQGARVSPEANLSQLVRTCQYLLDRADEARRLSS